MKKRKYNRHSPYALVNFRMLYFLYEDLGKRNGEHTKGYLMHILSEFERNLDDDLNLHLFERKIWKDDKNEK